MSIAENLEAKGMAKGIAKGMAEGIVKGEGRVFLRQYELRFGPPPTAVTDRVRVTRPLD